ncbi:hypothetical protein HZY62_12700 [Maribacter polysiphoniae]|uniref:Uncharacterized protein n=1 Tax=Maribacter polysiphoniae TaxID=429344 RepID=A0ABR7W2V1_9FLAO|nr:hypothetical protein [Maribacter polysiphoniae]MBD1261456.1 hypothetical protein [Maribacter polysiphoniae]
MNIPYIHIDGIELTGFLIGHETIQWLIGIDLLYGSIVNGVYLRLFFYVK